MTDMQEMVEAVEFPKVYVFANGRFGRDDIIVIAVGEDGHYFGSHACSSMGYARHDLTETPKRIEALMDHYPDGYVVVVLPEGEAPPDEVHERFMALAGEDV